MIAGVGQGALDFGGVAAVDCWRWTPERAADYNPGHPWAHPDAYPDDVSAIYQAGRLAAEAALAKPVDSANWHLPHDFPRGTTAKAGSNRHAAVAVLHRALAGDGMRYRACLWAARVEPNGPACMWSNNREALASKHNHVFYHARVLTAVAALYPEFKGC